MMVHSRKFTNRRPGFDLEEVSVFADELMAEGDAGERAIGEEMAVRLHDGESAGSVRVYWARLSLSLHPRFEELCADVALLAGLPKLREFIQSLVEMATPLADLERDSRSIQEAFDRFASAERASRPRPSSGWRSSRSAETQTMIRGGSYWTRSPRRFPPPRNRHRSKPGGKWAAARAAR